MDLVWDTLPATACIEWPQLNAMVGCRVWVKHENHSPIGAFKLRGGLVYIDAIARAGRVKGVVAATRGNHGQSVALAAARAGIPATVVVPRNNSREKNAAIRAFGATVVEHGNDLQDALDYADELALGKGWHLIPPFDRRLVLGVATCAWEIFHEHPKLDELYVPIGMGSAVCGAIAARDAYGAHTAIVGVVAEQAPAYALSLEAGKCVSAPATTVLADGVACRVPNEEAFAVMKAGIDRIVSVSEGEIASAMRAYYVGTHNLAEGAGALTLAAVAKEQPGKSRQVGIVLSGGNVDWEVFQAAMGS